MYCVKCGVKLTEGVSICPLCHTKMNYDECDNNYQATYSDRYPNKAEASGKILLASVLSILYLIALLTISFICYKTVSKDKWAIYTIASILLSYLLLVFPLWFKKYSPYVAISVNYVSISVYLGLICMWMSGRWYYSFALPLMIILFAMHMVFYTLFKYCRKGFFYIFGALFVCAGLLCTMVEYLQHITYDTAFIQWSAFVLIPLSIIGLFFILVGIIKPLQNAIIKRFFI